MDTDVSSNSRNTDLEDGEASGGDYRQPLLSLYATVVDQGRDIMDSACLMSLDPSFHATRLRSESQQSQRKQIGK